MLPNLSGLALPTEGRVQELKDKAVAAGKDAAAAGKTAKDKAAAAAKDAAGKAVAAGKEAAKAGVEQGKLLGEKAKREMMALEEKFFREWMENAKLTRSTAPDALFKKANEIYKEVHKEDIPKDQADKMRKGLSEAFGTPLVGLSITGDDAVWTSSETADERRLREEADQKVLEKSAIEFFLCFLVWCFDMAVGSESGAGPMCRQYGF